jgi:hypothetical protein
MLNRIGGEVDGTDIIITNHGGVAKRMMKLLQKLEQPVGFGDTIRHCSIFRLGTRPGHCRLTFG